MNDKIYKESGISSSRLHHNPGHWDTIAHENRYAFVANKCLDEAVKRSSKKALENGETPYISIIDCGCGETNLFKALTGGPTGKFLKQYTGIEYDKGLCEKTRKSYKASIESGRVRIIDESFCGPNSMSLADKLVEENGGKYNFCISLEAIEHLPYLFGGETDEFKSLDEALDFFRKVSDCLMLSTPNFSERYGKANEHTREWRFEELKTRLEARYNVVIPIVVRATKLFKPEDLREPTMYDYLKSIFEQYPSNPMQHFLAPHIKPESPIARNILWVCSQQEGTH